MKADLRQQVLELYVLVDREVAAAGPVCSASGRCCRFKEYGHTLFLSHLEAEVLLDGAPPYDPAAVTAEFCPFQVDRLCTAREVRPLGCRIYHCDPTFQHRMPEITEAALQRLKQLAEKYATGWRYAPLHVFLSEGGDESNSGR